MINLDTLKELVRLMVDNDLSEVELHDEQESVSLKRGGGQIVYSAPSHPMPHQAHPGHADHGSTNGAQTPAAPASDPDAGLVAIESPMVGTYFTSPSPDSPPFVKNGSQIGADSVVCIIEAMKVFNEIKAEVSGTIEKILVKNGEPVEFGQKLFLVRPS